jgi:hypothetical protein
VNEVVQSPAIQPLPKSAPTAGKQNLLDLDRAGLEKFFVEVLGEKVPCPSGDEVDPPSLRHRLR